MAGKLLADYEDVLRLTETMRIQAQRLDWPAVEQTQQQRAMLLATLPTRLPALAAAETATLRELIGHILAIDTAILELAEPSLTQMAGLLAGLGQRNAEAP